MKKLITKILGMFSKVKNSVHKIREDFEDFLADRILVKLGEMKSVDELEKLGAKLLINYISKQFDLTIPDEVVDQVAEGFSDVMGKANKALVVQLKKRKD